MTPEQKTAYTWLWKKREHDGNVQVPEKVPGDSAGDVGTGGALEHCPDDLFSCMTFA